MGDHDLLGRAELLDDVVGWFREDRRPFGLLRGPAGVGKTALSAAVVARLVDAGMAAHRVRATEASRTVPFGALAPLLAGGTNPDGGWGHPAAVLTALLESVRVRFGDRFVLVVDDLPLLDDGSLTAVLQLGEHSGIQVLATARDEHRMPEAYAAAASAASGKTWMVEPLGDPLIEALATALLRAPLAPPAARQLCDAARGIPLFAIELVTEAQRTGAVRAAGTAMVFDDIPLSARLRDLVDARIDRLDEEARAAAELVAAGRPLPAYALDEAVAEHLEAASVIVATDDGDAWELAHPLVGEALRSSTPRTRWQRRLREAATLWAELDPTPDRVLRTTVMTLDGGGAVGRPAVLAAAQRALELLDHRLVSSLVTPLADRRDHDALVLRGTARSAVGETGAADDLRLAMDTAPDDASLARAAQRLALELGTRQNDAAGAADAARAGWARVTDESARTFLDAEARKWEVLLGDTFASTDAATDPGARLNECAVGAVVAAMSGQLDRADALVAEGVPLARAHREVLTYGEELLQLSGILAVGFRGDVQVMFRSIDDARQSAQLSGRGRDAEGLWRFLEASAHQSAGSHDRAEVAARTAITLLVERDFIGLELAARGVWAGALAQLGRVGEARQIIDGLPGQARDDQRAASLIARAEAAMAANSGRPAGVASAIEILATAAAAGIASGFGAMGAVAAHDAVCLGGAAEVTDLLTTFAATTDGAFFTTLADHARGVVEADASLLESVARRFVAFGLAGAAAAAYDDLAELRRRTRTSGAAEAARRAQRLRAMPIVDGASSVLTTRETEIALAAAGRARSKEIADDLGLSVRTVDNHLRSVYRKLAVSGRDELAEVMRDLEPGG